MRHPQTSEERLLGQVRTLIAAQGMFEPGERVVVAVSGGADSVALLRVLCLLQDELGISLHTAHLDHQLRGEASRHDAAFVEELCRRLGVPCTSRAEDVRAFARTEKRSLEEGARIVRYGFFSRLAEEVGAQKVATGHTLDDQAETILHRLIRGTGTKGLAGIPAVRDGLFVRPLLCTSRREITEYLQEIGQPFRTDRSNADLRFARNRIRHELIPLLVARYGAGLLQRLGRAAQITRDEDALLDELAADALDKTTKNRDRHKIILDMTVLLGYHIGLQRRILRRAFREGSGRSLEYGALERLLERMSSPSGVLSMPGGAMAQKWGDLLILKWRPIPTFARVAHAPGTTTIPELDGVLKLRLAKCTARTSEDWRSDASRAAFDWAAVRGPLAIRSRRRGDTLQPFGMAGHRKVKNILIDRKVPRLLRDEVAVLADDEKILWIIGIATSERGRITADTNEVLWATFEVREGGWLTADR